MSLAPPKLKVLVIDDDPIALEVARERLSSAGYLVTVREEALGTTQYVRDEQPDIVLLDVVMPALNGERLAALLKGGARTKETAIILFSSKSEAELVALVESTGAVGAISKTQRAEEFIRQFEALARRRFPSLRPKG
jgi:two-component system, OmpR family, response regulator